MRNLKYLHPLKRDVMDMTDFGDDVNGDKAARKALHKDNIQILKTANQAIRDILKSFPKKATDSASSLRAYIHGSDETSEHNQKPSYYALFEKAKRVYEARRSMLIKSVYMATGLCAGITCLINMSPKLIRDILCNDRPILEIVKDVISTVGDKVWRLIKRIDLRVALQYMIGPTLLYTAGGQFAVEVICAIAKFLTTMTFDIGKFLLKLGGVKVLCVIAAVFSLGVIIGGLEYVLSRLSWKDVSSVVNGIAQFVVKLYEFVTHMWGAALTLTGIVLVCLSQSPHIVQLINVLWTSGSISQIAPAGLAGADVALKSWFGLNTFTYASELLFASAPYICLIVVTFAIAISFFRWATAPKDLADLADNEFNHTAGTEDEELQDTEITLKARFEEVELRFFYSLLLAVISLFISDHPMPAFLLVLSVLLMLPFSYLATLTSVATFLTWGYVPQTFTNENILGGGAKWISTAVKQLNQLTSGYWVGGVAIAYKLFV